MIIINDNNDCRHEFNLYYKIMFEGEIKHVCVAEFQGVFMAVETIMFALLIMRNEDVCFLGIKSISLNHQPLSTII